jgi:hypothetical protein
LTYFSDFILLRNSVCPKAIGKNSNGQAPNSLYDTAEGGVGAKGSTLFVLFAMF